MVGYYCYGRECKLGWGYNDSLKRLIPVEGEPPNVTSEVKNVWEYGAYNLSSTDIPCWTNISIFLEQNCRKEQDFRIIFDNNEYWEVHCWFERQTKSSEKVLKYPPNCSHFVSWIDYGVDLRVQFPKIGFSEESYKMKNLFRYRSFNETQKKTKCRVLVNYNEIKEITLEELVNFMDEIKKEEYSQHDIPVLFAYEKLSQEIRATVIRNEDQFAYFLSYLYCVCRKIEMKMEKAGYPVILQHIESGEKSFDKITANLNKAKENYKFMNRNDFLEMYPVLKRLFFCYTDYIKYSIDNMNDIDEGDHLPGTDEEIKPWLKKLNQWLPDKNNKEWVKHIGSFISVPPGYEQLVHALCKIYIYSCFPVINDSDTVEPYIMKQNEEKTSFWPFGTKEVQRTKILFGLVDMEGAIANHISNDSSLLELECPEGCTPSLRRWICSKCGDFVNIRFNAIGRQFLLCFCGSKRYDDKLLICHHPSHQQNREQPIDRAELLRVIDERLKHIRERKDGFTDKRIHYAIHIISLKKPEDQIKEVLRNVLDVRDSSIDHHTEHVIELYLENSN